MKNTKKVLSVVLAVVMALSALTLVAFAHSYTGVEDSTTTSVKYEVVQVASATDKNGQTYTAVDNDIYAVTVYAKAAAGTGIMGFQVPIQYDKTLFEPMITMDEGDLYCAYDGWFTDIGITAIDFYTNPARYSDTNMYKNGAVATKLKADVFMLGNENAGSWTYQAEYVGPGDPRYSSWIAGLDADKVGIVFTCLDDTSLTPKTAWLNVDAGVLVTDDYLPMTTIYFHRIDGVDEADCYGAEFGIASADNYGTQLAGRTAATPGYQSSYANPKTQINYINGAVESPVKPLVALTAAGNAKSQAIAFNLSATAAKPYDASMVESVDYRFVAQFSTTAFPIDYNADGTVNATDIDEVGYVMAKAGEATAADLTAFDAAGISALSKDSGTIRKCWTAKISTDMAGGAAFAFSCRIKGIAVTGGTVASEYIVAPYVLANGQVYYGAVQTSTVQAKYDANIAKFLANKNA